MTPAAATATPEADIDAEATPASAPTGAELVEEELLVEEVSIDGMCGVY